MSETKAGLFEGLIKELPDARMEVDSYGMINVWSTNENIHPLIKHLKENGFSFLTDLTGIHYPENEGCEFQVVYHLHNLYENTRVRVKVNLSKESISIPTITDLFAGANWMERETFDFFGIEFTGHPNLSRILNVDDMDYHPMRKEFALEDETRLDKEDKYFGR